MTDYPRPPTTPSAIHEPPPLPDQKPAGLEFDALVTGKNLFRIGLGLVLLALGFLFRYGWQQGWITPSAQIGAGAVVSLAFVVLGDRMRGRRDVFGHMLQGGGVAGLYLTAFAAHQAFAMTDRTVAFAQLIAISALGVGLSLRRDSVVLAGVSVAGAFAAPFLIGGRIADGVGDVVYLGVVMATAVGMAFKKEWPALYAVASVGAVLVAGADLVVTSISGDSGTGAPLAFAVVTYGLLGVAPTLAHLASRGGDRWVLGASPIMALAGGAFVLAQLDTSPGITAAISAAAAALHLWFYVVSRDDTIGELQLVPASAFGLASAGALFDADATALVAAAVGAGLVLLGTRQGRLSIELGGVGVYALAAVYTMGSSTIDAFAVSDTGTVLVRFGVFALAGMVALLEHRRVGSGYLVTWPALVAYLGTMALTFTELTPINVGLVTAVWAVVGTGLVVVGHQWKLRPALMTGLATIALTIGKLFLVDLTAVEPVWRISLFAGFGIALLAVGYWISRDEG